jgi:DNA mismatch repair protein MSH4
MQLTDSLRTDHDIPLQSIYRPGGFIFSVKKADLDHELPAGFINVVSKGPRFIFSSVELVSRPVEWALSVQQPF